MKRLVRYLGAAAAIFGVALFVLWLWGGRTFHYDAALTVAAPAKTVFPFLSEPDKMMSWMDGVDKVQRTCLPPPPRLSRS